MRSKIGAALVLVVAGLAMGSGCQVIVDAKERTLDPALGDVDDAGTECDRYCATIMANCTGNNAQYVTLPVCLADCARFPLGQVGATLGNSLMCREHQADLAVITGEPADSCVAAGPAGGGTCGTTCEGYCTLMLSICPEAYPAGLAQCAAACGPMTDLQTYNTSEQVGDTVQCRIFHVSAATQSPVSHCPHAGQSPTKYCLDPGDAAAPPPEAGATCEPDDPMDACDVCEAVHCCTEMNNCYNDAICGTADTDLDSCVTASDAGTVADCYQTFAAMGPIATAIYQCKLSHCASECGVPSP